MWGSEFTTKAASLQGYSSEFMPSFVYMGLGPVLARARVSILEVLDLGVQAAARGGARCASQVLDRDAQTDTRGAAQVLNRGAQAVARGTAR